MQYDNPLRTIHQISGTPTSALTKLVPVPFGATRFRLKHAGAALNAGSNDSTNTIEVGISGDSDKFYTGDSLAVTSAAPADTLAKDLSAKDLADTPHVLITVGADAGATGDTVDFDFLFEWF